MNKVKTREEITSEEIRKGLCLPKHEADYISSAICEVFHERNLDISWALKKGSPRFCGIIAEIFNIKETGEETFLKLRVKKLGASGVAKPLGYCVVIGKVIKDE